MFTISKKTRSLIREALRQDIGTGDVTTEMFVPARLSGGADIHAKASGILCGGSVVKEVFRAVDSRLRVEQKIRDGARIAKEKRVFVIHGRIASILKGERVALNFLSRLSGIATLTHQFVRKVKGTRAKIHDTRKTTPLWSELEKYAVRCGGGENHRFGLWDEILVKENHWHAIWPLLEATRCRYFRECLNRNRPRRHLPVEIEVRRPKQLAHLLEGDYAPNRILLDHFSVRELRQAVLFVHDAFRTRKRRRKRPLLEASGGVHLGNVRAIARTGVDRISVGALTQAAAALDVALTIGHVKRTAS